MFNKMRSLILACLLVLGPPSAHGAPPRVPALGRRLGNFFSHGLWGTSLEQELNDATALAMQAAAAARAAGDYEEADMQSEVAIELNEYASQVNDDAAAAESYEESAIQAAESGDFERASEESSLADRASMEEEKHKETLSEMIVRSKELSSRSLQMRLNPSRFAAEAVDTSPKEVVQALSTSFELAHRSIKDRLNSVLGASPLLVAFVELCTLLLPFALLSICFFFFRQGAVREFSPRSEALLFSQLYWAVYFGTLSLLTLFLRTEPPLTAFAIAQPVEYVVYQVIVCVMLFSYVLLTFQHVSVEKTMAAGGQCALSLTLFLVSYITVTFPAMEDALPPSCGWPTFLVFFLVFAGLTQLTRKERTERKEE